MGIIIAFLIGAIAGYAFRGLIRKEIGKVGVAIKTGESKIATDIKDKI